MGILMPRALGMLAGKVRLRGARYIRGPLRIGLRIKRGSARALVIRKFRHVFFPQCLVPETTRQRRRFASRQAEIWLHLPAV
jgi:hypothetical protein